MWLHLRRLACHYTPTASIFGGGPAITRPRQASAAATPQVWHGAPPASSTCSCFLHPPVHHDAIRCACLRVGRLLVRPPCMQVSMHARYKHHVVLARTTAVESAASAPACAQHISECLWTHTKRWGRRGWHGEESVGTRLSLGWVPVDTSEVHLYHRPDVRAEGNSCVTRCHTHMCGCAWGVVFGAFCLGRCV